MTKTVSHKIAVLGFLLTLCLLATYYFHFILEAEIVFTHLFYLPIILAGLWWSRKSIAVALFLALLLLVSHALSPLETTYGPDVARAIMFVVVGTVVGMLNERRLILEAKLRAYSKTLEQRVEERTRVLRESEQKQRAILDSIGDAVIVLDENLNITWANPIAVEQYGAVLGRECYEAYKWLKQPCADCIARKTFADGAARSSEEEGTLKDGNRVNFVVTCSPVRDPDGEVVSVVEVLHDITERVRAKEALAEEKQRLGTILSTMNIGLILHNPDRTVAWVNQWIRRMFPHGDPVGQVCYEFFEGTSSPCDPCAARDCFETGEIRTVESHNQANDRWYFSIAHPMKDEASYVIQVLESVMDITEQKRAEEALREIEERLRSFMESSPDGFALLDSELNYVEVNKTGLKAFGRTREEVIGKNILDLNPTLRETGRYDEYLEVITHHSRNS